MSNVKAIITAYNKYRDVFPKSFGKYPLSDNIDSYDDLLATLNSYLDDIDEVIKKEDGKKFVVDDEKVRASTYGELLYMILVPYHMELVEHTAYRTLLNNRFIGHGFFSIYNQQSSPQEFKTFDGVNQVVGDDASLRVLYLSMCDYYRQYYGKFNNNEEAIEFICKYFSHTFLLDTKDKDRVISGLFNHITAAGSPGEYGKAYNGIALIEEHIENLLPEIVDGLLDMYDVYNVLININTRKQIYTIIKYANMEEDHKLALKFKYIDSILITDKMNAYALRKDHKKEVLIYSRYRGQFGKINMPDDKNYLKVVITTDPRREATWSINQEDEWILKDEGSRLVCGLKVDGKFIYIFSGSKIQRCIATINLDDYQLNAYEGGDFTNELIKIFKSMKDKRTFTFSYLYLNNYRNMSDQSLSFDHKYEYDASSKTLRQREGTCIQAHEVYGSAIESLTCIVGKNGMGKTSMIEFLKTTFYEMLNSIKEDKLPVISGFLDKRDCVRLNLLDYKTDFLVVFRLDGEDYCLHNIEFENVSGVNAYEKNMFEDMKDASKLYYFSSMLEVNDRTLFETTESNDKHLLQVVDYSEKKHLRFKNQLFIDQLKSNDLDKKDRWSNKNVELCYQVAFLCAMGDEKIERLFDRNIKDDLLLVRGDDGGQKMLFTEIFTTPHGKVTDYYNEDLGEFLVDPSAHLQHLSSGQYAKLAYLSRMYWCLGGYKKYHKFFEGYLDVNAFDVKKTIRPGESALIFIDEGEVYYHPEWQRDFISILLDMIKANGQKNKIQVVLTTNSPFMISDVLGQDVVYLSSDSSNGGRTFGQNLHTLIQDNFFVEYSTGEFSRKKIEQIIDMINGKIFMDQYESERNKLLTKRDYEGLDILEKEALTEAIEVLDNQYASYKKIMKDYRGHYLKNNDDEKSLYSHLRCLIDQIGEGVYREKLMQMLDQAYNSENTLWALRAELDAHKLKMDEIQEQIKAYEHGEGGL